MRSLDEADARRLLAQYGVPVVAEMRASDTAEAVAAAEEIGFPVVLKACGSEFPHKTERGLVRLNLHDAGAVRTAAGALLARIDGRGELTVQSMVSGPRELLVGMVRDPQFGPVITFGLGGVLTESLADIATRVCPIGVDDALEMQGEIRACSALGAVRGMPPVDAHAVAGVILAVARLASERPDIDSIDINPLIVAGSQPIAVDSLVVLRST